MILVNDIKINQDKFGDETLKCDIPRVNIKTNTIYWCYDCDSELFTLITIVDYIRDLFSKASITLVMPYIPHARQDRMVSDRLFTLKSFAKIINSLNFDSVYVLDPHSDVATALLDRIELLSDINIPLNTGRYDAIMYPDAGAAKKYSSILNTDLPVIIGNKKRNKEGRIERYELLNFPENAKRVVIRDDICSYGGTFSAAAKELKERGVEHIDLIISHCENNILKGDVLSWMNNVYTTDSICTIKHPKIQFLRQYRVSEGTNEQN